MIAKILWPETEEPVTMGTVKMKVEKTNANFIDAAAAGADTGHDARVEHLGDADRLRRADRDAERFSRLGRRLLRQPRLPAPDSFGWILGPLAIILGAPKQDAAIVGNLIANKTVINEFFAFSMMKMSPRS